MADADHIMHGLLGPDGDQVGCDECFRLLDQYVDRELAGEDVTATMPHLHVHLLGCPVCADEHESLRSLVRGEQA